MRRGNNITFYKKILALVLSAAVLLCAGCGIKQAAGRPQEGQPDAGDEKPAVLSNDTSVVYDVEPEYIFTYAENQTEDYPTTQGAYRFAQLVNERTGGRIRIRVYANAQLGDENSTLEQLQFGGIDFVRCSMSVLAEYSDMACILMLPYLYKDAEHMWSVLDGETGAAVVQSLSGKGMVPLSWYDAGVRSFYFKKPVYSLEELSGLSIRVQPVKIMEEMIRLLGAEPVPVAYENVYSAIQTGSVDGAENNWSSYDAMRHNEVAPYYMTDEHVRIPEMQIMSEATWSVLSDEDRQLIRACAQESAAYERELWRDRETAARQRVLANGCREIILTDAEKEKFHKAIEPLYKEFAGEYMDLVEKIRQGQQ